MGIEYFLQQLVNGICLGGMYALMSVGYSLVYSIMNFSNFAHGGVIMVGAYVGYFALTALNVPFLPAFLLCGVGSGLLRRTAVEGGQPGVMGAARQLLLPDRNRLHHGAFLLV